MVSAIILAAHADATAGDFPPLRPYNDGAAIDEVVRRLGQSPIDDLVVVTGAQRRVLERVLERLPCRLAHNAGWESGHTLAAVQTGLKAMKASADAALVCPGHLAELPPAAIARLIRRFQSDGGDKLLTSQDESLAGLMLVPRAFWSNLQALPSSTNLAGFLSAHAEATEAL